MPLPNEVVLFPDTLSAVVVTPVAMRLVATRLLANTFVAVALVVVLLRMLLNTFTPEKVLLSAKSVEDAAEVPIHVPAIAKHPVVREIPLPKVEVLFPETLRALVVAPVKKAFVPKRLVAKKLVDVACVLVEFAAVKFWNVD